MLSGFGPPGTRDVEFFVCEEGTRAVAWVLLQIARRRGATRRGVLEHRLVRRPRSVRRPRRRDAAGARRPYPGARPPVIHAWWPARLDPVQLAIHRRKVTGSILMTRPLGERGRIDPPLAADDVLYWHADAF